MRSTKTIVTCVVLCMLAICGKAQNFNNALRVAPTGSNNGYVAINGLSLDTLDFTVELWIKADSDSYNGVTPFNDPSIFGNKNWDNGGNTGVEIAIYTGGRYKVNFTPASSSRVDQVSSGPQLMSRWNHIAVSVQRMGYIRLYTNGILTDSINISSTHGRSINSTYPYNFCDDGTGAYAHPLSAYVDEFRVWKGARTADQIRRYMCRTVPAGTANLMVYYPMQHTTGTVVTDASGSGHNGTLTNPSSCVWTASNAPVGDSSSYVYTSTWSGTTVSVGSAGSGVFSASNIGAGQSGMQVYRTNYPPNNVSGITLPGSDSVYFGVYPVLDGGLYQVNYDYSNYPAANTYEAGSILYARTGVTANWANLATSKNTATNIMQSSGTLSSYEHFVLGNFTTTYVNADQSSSTNFSVAPNPTSGMINLTSANGNQAIVTIFTMSGQIVHTGVASAWPYELNISHLPAGNYILNCKGNDLNESFRINKVQ